MSELLNGASDKCKLSGCQLAAKDAEIARLREVLADIAKYGELWAGMGAHPAFGDITVRARAALSGSPDPAESVEDIVEELAADIRARAPARFSADYPLTLDFKVGMLIADWRKRAEDMRAKCEAIAHGFSLEANQGRNRLKVSESWRDDQTPSDVYNLGADDSATFIADDIAALKGKGEG